MAQAKRDENFVPTLIGVSSSDGTTPINVYVDPVTHRLLVDLASGAGTVTTVSVVTANGFAGTVADPTTTPAITLETTVTGILKGDGTAMSAAVANTDYQVPISLTTTGSSGAATFDGTTLNIPEYAAGTGVVETIVGTLNRITVDSTDPANPIVDISSAYVGQNTITTLGTITTGTWQGTSISTTYTDAKVVSVSGTLNRITSTGGGTPVLDISASYVGQASITTLGTITTGVWNGTDIALADGGTGASLADPGADRIMFWDDSAGAVTWLAPGVSLSISTTTLNTIQDIRTSATPTFTGANLSGGTTTLGIIAGSIDAGGATSFEIPNSAAPTVNADGEIALDTTVTDFSHGIIKFFGGEEQGVVSMPIAQFTSPQDGDVVTYVAASDEFQLQQPAGGGVDVQTFTSSGTWTKPGSGTRAFVQIWGGGGSGAREVSQTGGGGGGGAYLEGWFDLADLGATETVTIGAGGASKSGSDQAGDVGGTTTFGSHATVYGGGGGSANTTGGGGGGGVYSAGATTSTTGGTGGGPLGGTPGVSSTFGGGGGGGNVGGSSPGGASVYGGGGGGGQTSVGGSSMYGGGGGGSGGVAGGTSTFGGDGGAGGGAGAGNAGQQPGGGGGAGATTSGAGGAGMCIVTVF